MKALIKVGYACNEHCTFCHTLDVRHIDGSSAEVHAKIARAKELGHSMVVFSGGEATIRPEIFDWAGHVAAAGLDLGLVTNGQMLAYPEFLERLLSFRLKYVYMSLHGGSAKVHNALVRSHGFENAVKALANLTGRGLDLTVNAVITRQNLDHLRGLVELILGFPDVTLKFSMVQPKGGGDRLFRQLTPSVSEVAAKVHDAITFGLERSGGHGPRFAHDGIPLCLLPGYEQWYDDLKTHRYATMIEVGEADFFPVDDKAKVHPEPCRNCALRGPCPGLYEGYHASFGDGELRPVQDRPRSNSFTWTFEGLVGTDVPETVCPLRVDGVTPWDRGRTLFVRNGPRIARYRTESRDFADTEIEAIKHELGQVYFDRSRKPAPDDFANDLVQLRRSGLCSGCPESAHCTGLFEPVFEDVFTRDDAHVRRLVSALSGDVLDVGCGEGPYEDILGPLAGEGRIRYTGLEPDPERVDRLRERWPWATLVTGTAEALDQVLVGPANGFDHILVLRSWNHLRDPAMAVERLVAALRPGGTLVVVDNVAFGLARTRDQTSRAIHSTSAFEHYRNDDAGAAHALMSKQPLELIERRDVSSATSNQWLLRYRSIA